MKKYAYFLLSLGCLAISLKTLAQSPQSISYQAVMRDNVGALLSNQNLDATFIIHQGGTSNAVYTEQINLTTNGFGLFTHAIGSGVSLDDFGALLWGSDEFYLEVLIDIGAGPISLGTQQLLSVPYSLYADKAGLVEELGPAGGDLSGNLPNPRVEKLQTHAIDPAPPQTGEILKWDGNQWTPSPDNVASGGGSVNTTARLIGDGSTTNPLDLAPQAANNGQILKWDGSVWIPADDNVNDADADATNELQSLSLSGTQLSLSDGGGSVSLPTGTTYTSGSGILITGNIISNSAPDQTVSLTGSGASTVSGTYPNFTVSSTDNVDDADADATNELQNLSLSGTQLSLSNGGGSVSLPTGTTYTSGSGILITGNIISNSAPDQTVSLTGSGASTVSGTYPNFTVSSTDNVDDADADATNELQNLSLSGTQLSLSNGGGTVSLPPLPTYTGGTGISVSGTTINNTAPDQTLSLSGGGATTVSGTYPNFSVSSTDNVNDADADATNEIQSLSLNGTQLILSNGGGSVVVPNGHWNPTGQDLYYNNGDVSIGTTAAAQYARLHLLLDGSGNFDHLRLESPVNNVGFGILFEDPLHSFYVGQNVGNWNDGRFQIAPNGSNHWFTMLSNGNVGLTRTGFTTPLARFQVPQNGDIDASGILTVTQAAIYIGENANNGIAMDHDQIESVGQDLRINALSPQNLLLVDGGANVGIRAGTPQADLHVGEGLTVLFGADTLGKSNFYPDPKMMFLPGKGGAFRVGQLNADGSLIGGTGYDFWDPNKLGWASVAIGNNTRATGAGSVALGIRADARNFGSVALGHLSRTLGNSAVAAGYYTRADAFVGTAVGAGNVGGGNANSWIATDPIFEVGNSIDTTNRSNAFTVMKNGRVGINHHNPQSMLDIEQPNQGPGNGVLLNLSGIGHWETSVDNASDYNLYFNNALKAYILDTDGTYIKTSDMHLKRRLEPLEPVLPRLLQLRPTTYQYRDNAADAPLSLGFIAQEVEPLFPLLVVEKEGIRGLKYDGFSVLAVKAIQEQQAIIEQQQAQIELLEKRLTELENQ